MNSSLTAIVPADAVAARNTLLRKMLSPAPAFSLIGPADSDREQAEALISARFRSAWQAEVSHFLPWLLTMNCITSCSAVAGIRPAAGVPLYLEQYLDQPVEQVLSSAAGVDVPRRSLVEIGNLAASQRGASHLLFLVMAAVLHRAGYGWMVFTATHGLRNNLQKLGFPLLTLADARPDRLDSATLAQWGAYYESEPLVMAGSLDTAMTLIGERPLMKRVLRLYRYQINYLAESLRGA